MKTIVQVVLICCLSAGMVSCLSPRVVTSEQIDNLNLGQYKTFNFYAEDDTLTKKLAWGLGVAKLAIADEMARRGYQQSSSNADMLINIGMVIKEEVDTRQTNFVQDAPRYIGQRRYSWKSEEVETGRYDNGTISVHLVDNKDNKMIWKGVVESIVPRREEKVQPAIQKAVSKLFTRLPSSGK